MKRFMSLTAVLLAFLMLLSGCSMIRVNEERDNAVVVATVNGKPLLKGDFKELYTQYLQYLGVTEQTAVANGVDLKAVRETLLDQMVQQEIEWQMAEKFGFTDLTEEQLAEVKENFYKVIDLATASYLVDDEGNPLEDPTPEQKDEARRKVIEDFGVDEAGYMEELTRNKVTDLLFEEMTSMASVTADEVTERYNEMVESDRTTYQGNEAQYEQAINNGSVVLYVPAGLRYLKHVLIAFSDEASDELKELRSAESAAADPEAAQAETNARRAEMAKEIEPLALEVLEKIRSGELTFEDAMREYSGDTQDPDSEGYAVASSGSDYDTMFVTEAFKLRSVGDISDLILTDFGYHIILYAGDVKAGPKTLQDTVKYGYDDDMKVKTVTVYEYVESVLLDEEKNTLYTEAMKLAKEQAEIKTYPDRVKDVGQ